MSETKGTRPDWLHTLFCARGQRYLQRSEQIECVENGVHTCGVLAESIELGKVLGASGCVCCEWTSEASDDAEGRGPCKEHVWIKLDDELASGRTAELDLRQTPLERLCRLVVTRLIRNIEYDPVMVVRAQSSAAGVLALLSEPDPEFKRHALTALLSLVPQFWAEISEHIAPMHALLSSFFSLTSQLPSIQ